MHLPAVLCIGLVVRNPRFVMLEAWHPPMGASLGMQRGGFSARGTGGWQMARCWLMGEGGRCWRRQGGGGLERDTPSAVCGNCLLQVAAAC